MAWVAVGAVCGFALFKASEPDNTPTSLLPDADSMAIRTARIEGHLADAARATLFRAADSDSLVVVALAEKDCLTCEDLGRQLRDLRSALPSGMHLALVAPAGDTARMERFVRIEHLETAVTYLARLSDLLDTGTLATPSAMVVASGGLVQRGIAHLNPVKNVRSISFAEELGFTPTGMMPLYKSPQAKEVVK